MNTTHHTAPARRIRRSAMAICGAAAMALAVANVAGDARLGRLDRAAADTAPHIASLPVTVTDDLLPTPQVDGVVWRLLTVGNTVFVGGKFATMRPFGAAVGANATPVSNFIAFDVTSGAPLPAFQIPFNGPVKAMAVSADGSTLYVGGNFTSVAGQPRSRIAALDARTGALLAWAPKVDFRVEAIAVQGDSVFFGGRFSAVNGQPRMNLAAVHATTGALTSWAPTADLQVLGMAVSPDGSKVVVGGQFTTLNGESSRGWGAISTATGAKLPWVGHPKIYNSTPTAGIYSVKGMPDGVYICGYSYDKARPFPFEGTAKANWSTGAVEFVNPTRGDTYDIAVGNRVLYAVNHMHDGGMIGVFPETPKWQYQRAQASTSVPSPLGRKVTKGDFWGTTAGEMLHWWPDLEAGTFTGQSQAAWALTATDQYLVMGGEFPRVNGVRQSGLARFAVPAVAPRKSGPRPAHELVANAAAGVDGSVTVRTAGLWDRDNAVLQYELLRQGAVVARQQTTNIAWWNRPQLTFRDVNVPAGAQTYQLLVRDPDGNVVRSAPVQVVVPTR